MVQIIVQTISNYIKNNIFEKHKNCKSLTCNKLWLQKLQVKEPGYMSASSSIIGYVKMV